MCSWFIGVSFLYINTKYYKYCVASNEYWTIEVITNEYLNHRSLLYDLRLEHIEHWLLKYWIVITVYWLAINDSLLIGALEVVDGRIFFYHDNGDSATSIVEVLVALIIKWCNAFMPWIEPWHSRALIISTRCSFDDSPALKNKNGTVSTVCSSVAAATSYSLSDLSPHPS